MQHRPRRIAIHARVTISQVLESRRRAMLRFSELRERLVEVPGRVRVMATVANRSGLMWQMHAPGARALFQALVGGSPNPSMTYRVHAANTPEKIATHR